MVLSVLWIETFCSCGFTTARIDLLENTSLAEARASSKCWHILRHNILKLTFIKSSSLISLAVSLSMRSCWAHGGNRRIFWNSNFCFQSSTLPSAKKCRLHFPLTLQPHSFIVEEKKSLPNTCAGRSHTDSLLRCHLFQVARVSCRGRRNTSACVLWCWEFTNQAKVEFWAASQVLVKDACRGELRLILVSGNAGPEQTWCRRQLCRQSREAWRGSDWLGVGRLTYRSPLLCTLRTLWSLTLC